eukprot:maker-scaffold_11-snap-gene-7.9-mRNA-1 protein AED:0.08 eAED:0.08 QI:122/0.66/0.5/1/1/1/4/0/537
MKIQSKVPQSSSYEVFLQFIPIDPDTGESGVLSRGCFEMWVKSRKNAPKKPEASFRKAIIAHLRAKDGRRPFDPYSEKLVLEALRKRRIWPCFSGYTTDKGILKIGSKGFKKLGYHEEKSISDLSPVEDAPKQKKRSAVLKKKIVQKSNKVVTPPVSTPEHYFPGIDNDLSTFDLFLEDFGLLKGEENALDPNVFSEENISVLETFCDVTPFEIRHVKELRKETDLLFMQYFGLENYMKNNEDICGDIKLLRFLRQFEYNHEKAKQQIEEYLNWRVTFQVESIRTCLLDMDANMEKLKPVFKIGKLQNNVLPFFGQKVNGDVIDIFIVRKQTAEDENNMLQYLNDHISISEFRNRLSRIKRRVVKSKLLVDLTAINDDSSWESFPGFDQFGFEGVPIYKKSVANLSNLNISFSTQPEISGNYDWFYTIKFWRWYLLQLQHAHNTYNPQQIDEVHVVGRGYIFNVVALNVLAKPLKDYCKGIHLYSSASDLHKNFDRNILPKRFGGIVDDPIGGAVSRICLSALKPRDFDNRNQSFLT